MQKGPANLISNVKSAYIEIKSGQTFASDYLQGLTYWRSLPDQANARVALVYGGDTSYLRQGIAVLSWQHWE